MLRIVCKRKSNDEQMKATMKLVTLVIFLLGFAAEVKGALRTELNEEVTDPVVSLHILWMLVYFFT